MREALNSEGSFRKINPAILLSLPLSLPLGFSAAQPEEEEEEEEGSACGR